MSHISTILFLPCQTKSSGTKIMKIKLTLLLLVLMPVLVFAQPAREKIKLDTGWSFHLGDVDQARNPEFDDSNWRKIQIPHDWSIEGEFSEKLASCTAYLPGGIGWYRKSLEIPASWKGKSITIEFDGVYNNSEVWINGHYLGWRPNGYISFYYDLTPWLKFGEENIASVRSTTASRPIPAGTADRASTATCGCM